MASPQGHSPTSSGTSTPQRQSYVPAIVSSFFRRGYSSSDTHSSGSSKGDRQIPHPLTFPDDNTSEHSVYTPPFRTASPMHHPPLCPLQLKGYSESTQASAQLLNRTIAEEIRLLVPPRLQLCEEWNLVYSLEQDGVSLGTLYKKCDELRGLRNGFVLTVRDGMGDLFGAYLTEAPHISPHYYGTGECFLWKASTLSSSILSNLPPPPSADTEHMVRTTTLGIPKSIHRPKSPIPPHLQHSAPGTGTSTPERIRFKAFPYSGVNDYMMLCDSTFLSVGGGDGHYGLWLDDTFEKGISSSCPTFGNEPLSEEGKNFEILGVEVWSIGTALNYT